DLEILLDLRLLPRLAPAAAHVERPLRQRHELHPQRAILRFHRLAGWLALGSTAASQRSSQRDVEAGRKPDATHRHGQAPFRDEKTRCAEATPRDGAPTCDLKQP